MAKEDPETGRFPPELMFTDLLLGGATSLLGLFLVFFTDVNLVWRLCFVAFLAAALWFLRRSVRFVRTRLEIQEEQVALNGHQHALENMALVKLRFYGSFRQKSKGEGTYVLTLKFSDGKGVQFDQRLSNFQEFLEAIARHNPQVDDYSRAYFGQHGINL